MITSFTGEHGFLSNFHAGDPFRMDALPGLWMFSAEHAFQAAKAVNYDDMLRIINAPSPQAAKRLGRQVRCHPEWDSIKRRVMLHVLLAKLTGPLREKLITTGDEALVEGNTWGDDYWGAVVYPSDHNPAGLPIWRDDLGMGWAGHNWLGRLLVMVREVLGDG